MDVFFPTRLGGAAALVGLLLLPAAPAAAAPSAVTTTWHAEQARVAEARGPGRDGAGVVVLMDLGSAVLSAETALELLDDDARARVVLSAAPLVEGLVGAVALAGGGADRDAVAAEALRGLAPKQTHLG